MCVFLGIIRRQGKGRDQAKGFDSRKNGFKQDNYNKYRIKRFHLLPFFFSSFFILPLLVFLSFQGNHNCHPRIPCLGGSGCGVFSHNKPCNGRKIALDTYLSQMGNILCFFLKKTLCFKLEFAYYTSLDP